ncbi:hypothetical protein MMC34_000234 [Xylographa carneopallida]|nr:hypothetical protein [Xylographa carneopallida]
MALPTLLSLPLLLLVVLHASYPTTAALSPGKVALYDDFDCTHPSSLNPSVSVAASTCLVVTNGEGLVISALPQCDNGATAALLYYSDPACVQQTTYYSTSQSCEQLAAGTGLYEVRSVMFACQPADQNPLPTATTTAVVSGVPVATGGSSPSSAVSVASSPAPTSAGSGSTTGSGTPSSSSSSPATSSSSISSSGSGSGSSTTPASTPSTSGLNTGDIIAIAVGVGIGIPAILVALGAWLLPNLRHRLAACLHFGGGLPDGPPPPRQQEMGKAAQPGGRPHGSGGGHQHQQSPYGMGQGPRPYEGGQQGPQFGGRGQGGQHGSPPPYNG